MDIMRKPAVMGRALSKATDRRKPGRFQTAVIHTNSLSDLLAQMLAAGLVPALIGTPINATASVATNKSNQNIYV